MLPNRRNRTGRRGMGGKYDTAGETWRKRDENTAEPEQNDSNLLLPR